MEQLLEYDDVLIKPRYSEVDSREEVNTNTILRRIDNTFLELDVPLIASPMKGIVGTDLIIELGKLGGIGILHRFHTDIESRIADIYKLEETKVPYGIAIGLRETIDDAMIVDLVLDKKITPDIICIDVANGYTKELLHRVADLYHLLAIRSIPVALMAGNIVSIEGVKNLSKSGATLYRVGIGSGQLCTTRNKTGIGYPQLSAIMEIKKDNWIGLIADGGIRNSGDVVKALSAGADAVMVGSMFAKTFESENNGVIYGMASKQLQEQFYGTFKSVEGVSKPVTKELSLKELVDDITWSIKSASTYVNAKSLAGLRRNAEFVRVSGHSIVEK